MKVSIVKYEGDSEYRYEIFDGAIKAMVQMPQDLNPPRLQLELTVTIRRPHAPTDIVNVLTLSEEEVTESGLMSCLKVLRSVASGAIRIASSPPQSGTDVLTLARELVDLTLYDYSKEMDGTLKAYDNPRSDQRSVEVARQIQTLIAEYDAMGILQPNMPILSTGPDDVR